MANAITTAPGTADDSTIRDHDRLIRHLAARFVGTGAPIDDLVQEGRIALWEASRKWAGTNGASLWTYARRAVFAAMVRFASQHTKHETVDDVDALASATNIELEMLVRECLALLTSEERFVIAKWLEGETFAVIGAELGMSHDHARDVFHAAVTTLRERAS